MINQNQIAPLQCCGKKLRMRALERAEDDRTAELNVRPAFAVPNFKVHRYINFANLFLNREMKLCTGQASLPWDANSRPVFGTQT